MRNIPKSRPLIGPEPSGKEQPYAWPLLDFLVCRRRRKFYLCCQRSASSARSSFIRRARGRRPMDDAGEEFRQHALQRALRDQHAAMSGTCRSPSLSRRREPGQESPRSWSATPCTSSRPIPTSSTRSTSRSPARRSNGSTTEARGGRPGRRMLRRGQPRPDPPTEDLSSRRSSSRGRRGRRYRRGGLEDQLGDINMGETMTMAPLVAKDKVFVGNSGGEYGVRGWIQALDANSGKTVWKAYSTGPDRTSRSATTSSRSTRPTRGRTSASPLAAERMGKGGGTVWGWVTFDPDLNLIYMAPAIPAPGTRTSAPATTSGPNGIFARDLDTGDAHWFYQATRMTCTIGTASTKTCCSISVEGQRRKVLVHPDRNGLLYMIDRSDRRGAVGELLSAVNAITGVDLATGSSRSTRTRPGQARWCGISARRRPARRIGAHRPSRQDRTPLHPAQQPVHGLGEHRDELHRRARPMSARRCA